MSVRTNDLQACSVQTGTFPFFQNHLFTFTTSSFIFLCQHSLPDRLHNAEHVLHQGVS